MNIFEQYGIKEIANCTLYSIALDKHDNEVYIPIMYFDTLKVSSFEQNANQSSARGGHNNPELINWNYGKEITVNLTDALYNPASLSLLWGGKFGLKQAEINGFWNPYYIYKKREDIEIISMKNNNQIDDQTYALLKRNKKEIEKYQSLINDIFNFIKNEDDFLKPYIVFSEEDNVPPAYQKHYQILTPKEIFKLFNTEILDNTQLEALKEQFINRYESTHENELNEIRNEQGYEPTYSIQQIYAKCYVNDYGELIVSPTYDMIIENIFKEYKYTLDVYTQPAYLNNYSLETYIEEGRDDFVYLLKLYNYSNNILIKRQLMNKDIYSFDYLIESCRKYLYSTIKVDTSREKELIINCLLSNYIIYQIVNDSNLYLYYIFNSNKIELITGEAYHYTSKYLGYEKNDIPYPYITNINDTPVMYNCNNFLPNGKNIGQPAEKAKLIIKNFDNFNLTTRKEGVQFDKYNLLHEILINNTNNFNMTDKGIFYDYEWLDCSVEIISLEGRQESYYIEHVDILYRINSLDYSRKLLLKYSDTDSGYDSQIDIYYKKKNKEEKIKAGTFYINDSFNFSLSPEDSIYSINDGLNDIYYLDRIEKCIAERNFCIDTTNNLILNAKKDLPLYQQTSLCVYLDPATMKPYESNATEFIRANGQTIYGNFKVFQKGEMYYRFTRSKAKNSQSLGKEIIVNADSFPGTYKLVGQTKTRARRDWKDSILQIEIPLCSISTDTSIILEAEGEPVTFNMKLKVLQNKNEEMIKIQKYDVEKENYNNFYSNSTKISQTYTTNINNNNCSYCDNPDITFIKGSDNLDLEIVLPQQDEFFCIPIDCLPPFNGKHSYLALPKNMEIAQKAFDTYTSYKELLNWEPETLEEFSERQQLITERKTELEKYRNLLLVKVPLSGARIYIDNEFYKIAYPKDYYGNIIGYEDIGTENIDGKLYKVNFITQDNYEAYSPIKFTIIGEVE